MTEYYFLMDVGGTEIKVNCLDLTARPILAANEFFPAQSQSSKAEILANFETIFKLINQRLLGEGYELKGIGLAFPGPFDYEAGISLMQGQRKYDDLYGVNLRTEFTRWRQDLGVGEVPLVFLNDATSFAFGEYYNPIQPAVEQGIYLTLGTGCGSTFIERGEVVQGKYGLDETGALYAVPFKNSVMDDYLSSNGLRLLAEKYGTTSHGHELARLASEGDATALALFTEYGQWIGEGIAPFTGQFQAEELVLGGQISQSLPYFKAGITRYLATHNQSIPTIRSSEDTSLATLRGLIAKIENQKTE